MAQGSRRFGQHYSLTVSRETLRDRQGFPVSVLVMHPSESMEYLSLVLCIDSCHLASIQFLGDRLEIICRNQNPFWKGEKRTEFIRYLLLVSHLPSLCSVARVFLNTLV